MASSTSTPVAPTGLSQTQPPPHRPLQREGAQYFLSRAEQALADAMMRSSPPPEMLLGKRGRADDQPGDGDDEEGSEPEDGSSTTPPATISTFHRQCYCCGPALRVQKEASP